MNKVYEKLNACYESIKDKIPFKPKVALILGSGLGDYAEGFKVEGEIDYHQIEGFPVSTVAGLVAFVAVFPLRPGSVSVTSRSTK